MNRGEFGIRHNQGRAGNYAFCWRGQSMMIFSDWMPVDTNRTYELSGWFKSVENPYKGLIFGVVFADDQKRQMQHVNCFSFKGSQTELAKSCHPDNRVIWLKDASNWKPGASYVMAFGADENMYTPDVSPRGIETVQQQDDIWKVVLSNSCGVEYPAGSTVTENFPGNNGAFLASTEISDDWTEWKGEIGPKDWWPGVAYAKIALYGLRRGDTQNTLLMDDFAFRILQIEE